MRGCIAPLISSSVYLTDNPEQLELLPEPQHVGLSSVDDGHGVLRGLDQGTVQANEKLGHLDREYLQAWHSQGASARVLGRKGVGKSKARTSVALSP